MAKKIRLNKKLRGFSIFEVDAKGEYIKCIVPSANLHNGKLELSGCLSEGREIFAETVRTVFLQTKVKGFTLRGYSVNADDYLLSCRVPLQLIDKTPGFQEYDFIR